MTGCVGEMRDQAAREAAKAAIRPVLAQRLPGVPVEPAVTCVIDNASADELLTLAREGAISGTVTRGTERVVVGILSRPETITCLAEDGLPALLGGF